MPASLAGGLCKVTKLVSSWIKAQLPPEYQHQPEGRGSSGILPDWTKESDRRIQAGLVLESDDLVFTNPYASPYERMRS